MYTYSQLLGDIEKLKKSDCKVGSIGKTESGKDIPYIFLQGKGKDNILLSASIHARENITSELIINIINSLIGKSLPIGIFFVPMINIDGVLIVQKGGDAFPKRKEFLLKINKSDNFFDYKANINGVDLNTNFNARWGRGKSNITYPSKENYIGPFPNSEKETLSLINFTKENNIKFTISYHCAGRVVYYDFFQDSERMKRDRTIAKKVASLLDYELVDNLSQFSSGGYKDWCISELKIPALTIEIGKGNFYTMDIENIKKEDFSKNIEMVKELLNDYK